MIFRFFEGLPTEVVFKIVGNTSRQVQATMAQVDSRFNTLSKDASLELTTFKSENKMYPFGELCLFIKKQKPTRDFLRHYKLSVTQKGKEISSLRISNIE